MSNDLTLTESELLTLQEARSLQTGEPPPPWGNRFIIPGAGIIAAGWVDSENVLLISHERYSITDIHEQEGKQNRLIASADNGFLPNPLRFKIPNTGNIVEIFGINGGDGLHITQDGWSLEVIYPLYPRAYILIHRPFVPPSRIFSPFYRAHRINLVRLEESGDWIKTGFSPSGKHFGIFASGGAEIFTRLDK